MQEGEFIEVFLLPLHNLYAELQVQMPGPLVLAGLDAGGALLA